MNSQYYNYPCTVEHFSVFPICHFYRYYCNTCIHILDMFLKLKEETLVGRIFFFLSMAYLKYLTVLHSQYMVVNIIDICLAHDRKCLDHDGNFWFSII